MIRKARSRQFALALCLLPLGLSACRGELGGASAQGPGSATDEEPGSAAETTSERCAAAVAVADTPLRRLTRPQYNNTVRDLLGSQTDLANAFPDDDRAGAFPANPRRVVTDAHVRRFMDAAEAIATELRVGNKLAELTACDVALGDAACVERFIRNLGDRAFRRPPSSDQVEALRAVYEVGSESGFESGISLVVEAMLQSPSFLYHVELKPPTAGAADKVALEDREIAGRLSYFLWQSLPDEELSQLADAGMLKTPEQVRAQAERLLASPRSALTLDTFASYWLGIASIDALARDAVKFPSFTPQMALAMREETLSFVRHVFNGEGSLKTLLTASFSIVPDPLLPIYGVTRPAGRAATEPLELNPAQRAGVLTHASVLATHSPSDHTSPVKRGVFMLNDLLCQEVKLPVGLKIPDLPPLDPKQTSRERFLQHEQPGCAGCHIPIDHLGFAFERYDSVGAYREAEAGQPIDDSGALQIGSSQDGPVVGAVEMANKLLEAPELRACVTKQWHRFALGRQETAADDCTLATLEQNFDSSGQSLRELVLGIVTQDSFRFRPGTSE